MLGLLNTLLHGALQLFLHCSELFEKKKRNEACYEFAFHHSNLAILIYLILFQFIILKHLDFQRPKRVRSGRNKLYRWTVPNTLFQLYILQQIMVKNKQNQTLCIQCRAIYILLGESMFGLYEIDVIPWNMKLVLGRCDKFEEVLLK